MARAQLNPLREAVRECRREIVAAAAFSFFLNLLMLTMPLYVLSIFRRVLQSQSRETLILLTIMALAAMVVYALLASVRARLLINVAAKFDTLLAEKVHAALIARAPRSNDPRNINGLRDLAVLRNLLAGTELQMLFDAPWSILFLAVIFMLHPLLGMLCVVAMIILLGFGVVNDLVTRPSLDAANATSGRAHNAATANVRNAEVIQGMGMMPAVLARWRRINTELLTHQTKASEAGGAIGAATRAVRLMIQILVFAVGAWLVLNRVVSPGAMMASIFLMARALLPLESAIASWKHLVNARQAYRRLDALLRAAPEPGKSMRLPAPEGRIAVEQVFFAPPGVDRPILRNVSFAIDTGTLLGIIGASAAGKSTLAKIIVGVWRPSSGTVRLDAVDTASWDPDDLGQYVGYMPQDVELFDGTVRDNISRMRDAPPEEIIEAARLAGAHEMILKLPDGYETEIGEAGSRLAGGQRQRIALARALFGNPRLLVLDEPNSNLDSEGEAALANALAQMKAKGVTTLVIAHRPSVLQRADRLLVLNNGRVEMFGPRPEVMAKVTGQVKRPVVELVKTEEAPLLTDQSASQ